MTLIASTPIKVETINALGIDATTISPFEAGSLTKIGDIENKADVTITALISALFDQGIRGNDWRAKAGLDSIKLVSESHKAAYAERLEFYGKACFTAAEKRQRAAPVPKKADYKNNGDYLDAKQKRDNLNNRPAWKMKNLAKRFDTLAKQTGEMEAPKKGASEKKTPFEQLSAHIQNALNVVQGDKTLPDSCKADEIASVLLALQKVHKLHTGKPASIDSIL